MFNINYFAPDFKMLSIKKKKAPQGKVIEMKISIL